MDRWNRPIAIGLCGCVVGAAWIETREACWALPPALWACSVGVAMLPHNDPPSVPVYSANRIVVGVSTSAR
jgi:hypothetical protein